MTQLISITPDPPERGKTAKICYDGTLPVTLGLSWTPTGLQPTSVTLTTRCTTITVPDTATTLVIHDDSGASDDLACVVA